MRINNGNLFNNKKKEIYHAWTTFENDNIGEQSNNELDVNSPVDNNKQSDGDDDENQSQGDEVEVFFIN